MADERDRQAARSSTGEPRPAGTRGISAGPAGGWEKPAPLEDYPVPDFPPDVLPVWLARFVHGVATATQTPPDLAGLLGLAAVATACARRIVVLARPDWLEPVNLYVLVVLPPGNRKSAVLGSLSRPIEDYEEELARAARPAIARADAELDLAKRELERLKSEATKATDEGEKRRLVDEMRVMAEDLAARAVPAPPRLLGADVTPEKLARFLHENGGRFALWSAEGEPFELMGGRYAGNAAPNLEVFLKAHSGDTLRVDRLGRSPEFVKRAALTIALTVQPHVLRGLLDKPGFRGRGLLGRFLYAVPRSLLGRRDVDPPVIPDADYTSYTARLRDLLRLPPDDAGEPHALPLSPSARRVLLEFQRRLEPRLGDDGDLAAVSDWAGKLAGTVVRLAGLLHAAAHADDVSPPWDTAVSEDTMARAVRLGEYLLAHARAAFAEMGADPEVEEAKRVLRWIVRSGAPAFKKRDAFEALKGTFHRVEELERPLAILEQHSYVRCVAVEQRPGPGRRPSPLYEVNPEVGSRDSQNSQIAGPLIAREGQS